MLGQHLHLHVPLLLLLPVVVLVQGLVLVLVLVLVGVVAVFDGRLPLGWQLLLWRPAAAHGSPCPALRVLCVEAFGGGHV